MMFSNFLSFMTTFCCIITSFQSNTTDTYKTNLLKALWDLHQYNCGETATCGSSEHVEPSEFVVPVPCCIPCSCLPSCVKQRNCCPWSVNGTSEAPITTSGLDGVVQDDGINKTNDGFTFGSEVKTVNWNNTGATDDKQRVLDRVHRAITTEKTTKDSETVKMIDIRMPKEKCIRPQVIYKPNKYLDSQAYMMVVNCPEGFKDRLTIDRCIAGMDETSLLDAMPVTSRISGRTYKNKHCLICNEKVQPDHIVEWRCKIVTLGAERKFYFFTNPDKIAGKFIRSPQSFSNIHFVPVEEEMARRCEAHDVISCNQTGVWDMYDELTESVCLDGYQLPIVSSINKQRLSFRNIGCLHCNVGRDLIVSELKCGYWKNPLGSASSFSVALNLKSTVPGSSNGITSATYIEQDVLQRFPHQGCQPGTLEIQGRCRIVACPRDHYVVDNKCVPLYDTLEGLDLHIQIQITPSQPIPTGISQVFQEELKQMTSNTLRDIIPLERRQASLWYMPRYDRTQTEHYVLDVFLFSQSNIIDYSVAVEQTKQFLFKLKSDVKLAVLEPMNIELDFQFKHGLTLARKDIKDMISGKSLKPLMEFGWVLMEPRPHITISEVNWCFKAAFSRAELDDYRIFIRVKSTDVIVFSDQFESEDGQFYICVDHFVKHQRVEDDTADNQRVKHEKAPAENDVAVFDEEVVVDSERGLILALSAIAVILVLVILKRVRKAKAEQQIQEPASSDKQPSDDIELDVINNQQKDDHLWLK